MKATKVVLQNEKFTPLFNKKKREKSEERSERVVVKKRT